MPRTVSDNILPLYLIRISHWFMIFMPVVLPFYESNHLGIDKLLMIQAVYSVTIVLLEIPSGYLADGIGRRFTLILGTSFAFLGFLLYSFLHGFWGFMAAEILLGIGASLVSGADSAILYDSLIEMNQSKDYVKYESKMTSSGNFAEAIAGVFGGFIAGYVGIRSPYYVQTIVALMGIPAAFYLVEPSIHKARPKISMADIGRIVHFALIQNPLLRRNILYSSVIGVSTLTMAWFVQPFFKEVNYPLSWYGILWTALNLSVAGAALVSYRVERKLGEPVIISGITVFVALGYFLTGIVMTPWALVFIFMFYIVRGIATPVLKDYIHRLTPSDMRATVLSIRNFFIRMIFSITGPLFGVISQKISLRIALISAGFTFLLLGSLTVFLYILQLRKNIKPI